MAPIKVFELAHELNLKTKTVLDICKDIGHPAKSHMTTLDYGIAEKIRIRVSNNDFRLLNIKPYYLDEREEKVEIAISNHALERVRQRWSLLYPNSKPPDDLYRFIAEKFSHSVKISNYSTQETKRIQRYGETLFFRHSDFTFVVQNSVIVTIEISNKGQRGLNAIKPNPSVNRT